MHTLATISQLIAGFNFIAIGILNYLIVLLNERIKCTILRQKNKKKFWGGAQPFLSPLSPHWGGAPPSKFPPPRRLDTRAFGARRLAYPTTKLDDDFSLVLSSILLRCAFVRV